MARYEDQVDNSRLGVELGMTKIAALQVEYNLFDRGMEAEGKLRYWAWVIAFEGKRLVD